MSCLNSSTLSIWIKCRHQSGVGCNHVSTRNPRLNKPREVINFGPWHQRCANAGPVTSIWILTWLSQISAFSSHIVQTMFFYSVPPFICAPGGIKHSLANNWPPVFLSVLLAVSRAWGSSTMPRKNQPQEVCHSLGPSHTWPHHTWPKSTCIDVSWAFSGHDPTAGWDGGGSNPHCEVQDEAKPL